MHPCTLDKPFVQLRFCPVCPRTVEWRLFGHWGPWWATSLGWRGAAEGQRHTRRTHCVCCLQDATGGDLLPGSSEVLMATSRRPEQWQQVGQVAMSDPGFTRPFCLLHPFPPSTSWQIKQMHQIKDDSRRREGVLWWFSLLPGAGVLLEGIWMSGWEKSDLRDQV